MSYRSSRRWVRVRRWWFLVLKEKWKEIVVVYLVSQYGERSATASISLLGPCSWRRSVFSPLVMCSLLSTDDVLQGGWIKWMECVHLRGMFGDENTREWKSSTLDIRRRHFGSHGSPRRRSRGRTSDDAERPPKCDGMLCMAEPNAAEAQAVEESMRNERETAILVSDPRIRSRLPSQSAMPEFSLPPILPRFLPPWALLPRRGDVIPTAPHLVYQWRPRGPERTGLPLCSRKNLVGKSGHFVRVASSWWRLVVLSPSLFWLIFAFFRWWAVGWGRGEAVTVH